MPTITLQVGQCGNQLGKELWSLFDLQRCRSSAQTPGWALDCSPTEYFRTRINGSTAARCLLIDTEPKVVNTLLRADAHNLFSRDACFLGHSGRGNNWACGYSQLALGPNSNKPSNQGVSDWDWRTGVHDPATSETCNVQHVMEGVRREAEACDSAPNFLMLHSLGGGSGSGLGSAILEALRAEYPLNYVAAVSVAPRTSGDSPMQNLNSVMSLSFLQAYADVVMMFNNTDMLNRAAKGDRSASLSDVNQLIASAALGALWPLDPLEVVGLNPRIRDIVGSVAADPCLKLVGVHTAPLSTALGTKGLWKDGCKSLSQLQPRYDALDGNSEVVVSSALLIGRGIPEEGPPLQPHRALHRSSSSPSTAARGGQADADAARQLYVQALGGPDRFACPDNAVGSVHVRSTGQRLSMLSQLARAGSAGSGDGQSGPAARPQGTAAPCVSVIQNSSNMIGLLDTIHTSAARMCSAGAYMHWYERYGCSLEALQEAIRVVEDMTDSYRLAHGRRDFL